MLGKEPAPFPGRFEIGPGFASSWPLPAMSRISLYFCRRVLENAASRGRPAWPSDLSGGGAVDSGASGRYEPFGRHEFGKAGMIKAIFITVYMFGLGLGFVDFIHQFTLRMIDSEQGSIWYLTIGTVLFLVAFGICGCLPVSRRTSEFVGWGVVLGVAIMAIILGVQKMGVEDTASLGTCQVVVFAIFGLVAAVPIMGVVVPGKTPQGESAHGH